MFSVKLVKVFSENPNEGNPAGVCVVDSFPAKEQMILVAKSLGFSESVFVCGDQARFFSPLQEVDFCAHAAIAAAKVIDKKRIVFHTAIGTVPLEESEGVFTMQQKAPIFSPVPVDSAKVASFLGVDESALGTFPLEIVSTGVPKLIVGVNSLDVLLSLDPDLEKIVEYCKESGARGVYVFTLQSKEGGDFHTRQFNPLVGIDEDPITGIAAGALATYARKHGIVRKNRITIEQGYCLGMPGKIFVDVSDGVRVGGHAVLFGEKTV